MEPILVAIGLTLVAASLVLTSSSRPLAAGLVAASGTMCWGLGAGYALTATLLPALLAGTVVPLPAVRLGPSRRGRTTAEPLKERAE